MKIEKVKEPFSVYIKIDGLKENFELDFLLDFLRFLKKDNIFDLWINAPRILKWYIDGDNDRIINQVLNNLTLCLQIFFEDKKETVEVIEK